MGAKPATACRYCGEPGELIKGAHRECKNDAACKQIRAKKGIPEERYRREVDQQTLCNTCHAAPRSGRSYNCQECRASIRNAQKRLHRNERQYWRIRNARKSNERPIKTCECGCGATFRDGRKRFATDECKPPKAPKMPKKRSPPPVRTAKPMMALSTSMARQMQIQQMETAEKSAKVVMPAGIKVTYGASSRGLRNLFGDENGLRWDATD